MAEGTLFVGNVQVLAHADGEGEFPKASLQRTSATPMMPGEPYAGV
jgi:hypothetical protein